MKNLKKVLCLLVAALMLLQVAAFAMSTNGVDYTVSAPDENGNVTVTATAFVGAVEEAGAKLATAVYDANGNVVSSNENTSAGGSYLKNTVTMQEGQTVKSFVWDGNNNPVEATATKDAAITPEDVEITFNNIDFETYVGEALTFDADDHEKEYTVTFENQELALPKVRVSTKENSIKYDLDEKEGQTVITFYAGDRIITTDPTNAGTVTNKNGDEKKKWAYLFNGKEMLDEAYTYEVVEKVVINYDYTGGGKYWTEADVANGGDVGVWYRDVVDNIASKKYTVAEGQTKTITLTINSPTELSDFIIVKAKDNTKDVFVNADGSPITWSVSDPSKTDNRFNGVSSYNYRLNLDGSRDFAKGFEASRATGVEYCATKVAATNNGSAVSVMLGRNTQNSDDDYITGSALTWERTPTANNRMDYTDIPAEYLGENYISLNKAAHKNLTFTFTVNDNIDSIVMFAADDNNRYKTSQFSIKDAEDSVSWEFTQGDFGKRRYQNTVTAGTYAYLEVLGYNSNAELSSGRYVRYNLLRDLRNDIGYNVFKINADSNYVNKGAMNTAQGSTYTAKYHEDYVVAGNTVPTPLITEPKLCYEDYVAYCEKNSLTPLTLASMEKDHSQAPKIIEFGSHMTSVFADRSGYDTRAGTGALLHSPSGFNFENATYIGSNLNWQNTQSTFRTYMFDTKDFNNPVFSFTANRDCRVVLVYQRIHAGNNWLKDPENGWDYFTTGSDDGFHIMELSVLAGNDANIRELGSAFYYYHFYTKDFQKGEEIVINTAGINSGVTPMVFVFENNDFQHNADLSDIKVAGESIADFDAATTTYTYELTEEQIASTTAPVVTATTADPTSDVEVTYNKTFPGGATIKVTDAHGFKKEYTVNFVCNVDMVYDLAMCDNGSYTYNGTTFTFKGNTVSQNNCTNALYIRGGMYVGAPAISDRPAYKVKTIDNSEYADKDHIIGAVDWYNGSSAMCLAYKDNTAIPNWINFKTKRAATVKVCLDTNNLANAKLVSCGYDMESDTTTRFTINLNADKVRYHKYIYTKATAANTTVNVPNANENDSTFSVVLFYADWE